MPNNEGAEQVQGARHERRRDFRDPKKHFVRKNGWLPVFEGYSILRKRRVNYLTLCSKEAIDVRYFAHKGCLYRNAEKNQYPSLTFVESNPEDYAVIAETLGKVRFSVLGLLEDVILDPAHESHIDLVATFPYDVINLDFCGDILPNGEHPYSRTLQCVAEIIRLQCTLAPDHAWHLFLTFRAQPIGGSPEANLQLSERLLNNIETRADLKEAYGTRNMPVDLANSNYAEFLRIGIPKLLAYTANQNGFRLESDSSFVYGRQQNKYKMVKIIVKLSPFKTATDLPNPVGDANVYRDDVRSIFLSEAVDVDLAGAAVQTETEEDLRPVIDELAQLGVVTS